MVNFKDMDVLNLNPTNTKEISKMVSIMERGNILGALAIYTKDHMKMGKSMALESIQVLMDLSIREIGKTEREMEKESKFHHLEQFKKFTLKWVPKKISKLDTD